MSATQASFFIAARRVRGLRWVAASLAATAMLLASWGAGVVPAAEPPKSGPAKPGAKEEIPPPEPVGGRDLVTRDGVQLKATFYPSNKGKEVVPVILLHSWKGDGREYAGLAPLLQKLGCAVLVPDLRGHGESTGGPGLSRPLDAAKFGKTDFGRMVTYDMETLKAFLMKKNNEGQLNIEKLCVVGGEMGASVALDWARHDWSWPPLVGKKQGQDVRALVLISPELNFQGLDVRPALSHPAVRSQLSVLIIVGNGDSRAVSDARRIEGMLSRYHPEPSDPAQRDLFFGRLDTKLQGTKMLGVQGINTEGGIMAFIDCRLIKQDASWMLRD
jgi:pimeloyl-ACP methyl ester carboxylesterase